MLVVLFDVPPAEIPALDDGVGEARSAVLRAAVEVAIGGSAEPVEPGSSDLPANAQRAEHDLP